MKSPLSVDEGTDKYHNPLSYEGSIEDISERKRVEEALRESEDRYRAFVANSSEAVWRFEIDVPVSIDRPVDEQIEHFYKYAYLAECNDVMAQMYGLTNAEEIVGMRMQELLPPSDPQNIAYLTSFIESGYRLIDAESQEQDQEGKTKCFLNNLIGIVEEGHISRAWGTQRDNTNRKRAEEALRKSERELRLIAENSTEAIFAYDMNRQLIYVNPAIKVLTGYSADELREKGFIPWIHGDDEARMMESWESLYEGRGFTNQEYRLITKDGQEKWGMSSWGPLFDEDGHQVGVQGRETEITERRLAAEALKEANQRAIIKYERLLERISSLGQTLGVARDLQTVFRALRDFAQVSAPCDSIVISLCDTECSERTAAYAWSDGEELDLLTFPVIKLNDGPASRVIATQTVLITHDFRKVGRERGLVTVGDSPEGRLPDSDLIAPMTIKGRTMGIIEIQSYESNAYMSEHSIAIRMAANLAAIAIENVSLFHAEREKEEQLRQSQKMEAIGKLAGGIAHDFNNLLTAITGYSELTLRRLSETDPLRRNIEEIKKAGNRAASLTRQLLAFSRKQVLQPQVMDFNAVLVEMFKMLQRLIGEDIDLLPVLDPSLGQIKADPGQIHQVLINLAVNARDAMPQGGKLTIKTANIHIDEEYASHHISVRPGRYVMLSVSDSGSGMDEATQARIFEPFFTTKEAGKGTGLGLSTVYGIIKQSGGNIWVYSEVGKGTTFKIYLPRADQEAEAKEDAVRDEHPVGTETILLVEDEEMVRNLTREILQMSGYKVIEARHGVEALQVCEQYDGHIQLMLTDVVMPQMGGRVLAEQSARLRPEMRVLYMSGYTDDAIVHHGVLDKDVAFIEKPFPPDALARKVREVLDADSA